MLKRFLTWLNTWAHAFVAKHEAEPDYTTTLILTPMTPTTPPEAPKVPQDASYLTTLVLPWSDPKNAFHNTRVLCDKAGLTLTQKNILCACVFEESGFQTNPRPNQNKDPKTGEVWSTDYGIVQTNSYWNIGPSKQFPSVQYVLDNPQECLQWMIDIYKSTGKLQPWASFTSGAYKKNLIPSSPMWTLKS